jgi:hypothetical protein
MLHFNARVIHRELSKAASVSFSPIPNERCDTQHMSVTGAHVDDPLLATWPSALEPGLIGAARVSAENVVEVRLCNFSGKTMIVPAQALRVSIAR